MKHRHQWVRVTVERGWGQCGPDRIPTRTFVCRRCGAIGYGLDKDRAKGLL